MTTNVTSFLDECTAVLSRTPATLDALLRGLPDVWIHADEGKLASGDATWSPYVVVGHLIHGEQTDWMPRLAIILEHGEKVPFTPFDRLAQFRDSEGKTLPQLLDEFSARRRESLSKLAAMNLQPEQLDLRGTHPALGSVTARQLLSTWTAHDLSHILQVARVMARRYRDEVGPWGEYLSVMR
jgi:hypothetical protein